MKRFIVLPMLILFTGCIREAKDLTTLPSLISAKLYARGSEVSTHSTEAVMNFKYRIEINADQFENRTTKEEIRDTIEEKIQTQVTYLFGAFKIYKYQGVPKLGSDQTITILPETFKYHESSNTYSIYYEYEGNALLDEGFGDVIKLPLPKNPDSIYQQSKRGYALNPCSDAHYNSQGDFWYFWNVAQCNTITAGVEYDFVDIYISRLANTKKTYPEYDRLIRTNQNGKKTLAMYAFLGYPQKYKSVPDNLEGVSLIKESVERTIFNLKMAGFSESSSTRLNPASFLHKFEKFYPQSDLTFEFYIFIGNTEISSPDVAIFHRVYKEALENSSVIFYGGHSGLGGNLDIDSIEANVGEIKFNKNLYQLLIFDSCSSFPYYSEMYFDKKIGAIKNDGTIDEIGSYNFDIITNGLSSYFIRNSVTVGSIVSSLNDVYQNGNIKSYQELLDFVHGNQMNIEPSAIGHLIAVSGDEDNPGSSPSLEINTKKDEFESAIMISADALNITYNMEVGNGLFDEIRSKTQKLYDAGAVVYLLGKNGKVLFKDKSTGDGMWHSSSVNTVLNSGFRYMTYVKLPENPVSTLYLVGKNKILYYKQKDKPLSESARMHPSSLAWSKLELNDKQEFIGVDETGQSYKWVDSLWIKLDR